MEPTDFQTSRGVAPPVTRRGGGIPQRENKDVNAVIRGAVGERDRVFLTLPPHIPKEEPPGTKEQAFRM